MHTAALLIEPEGFPIPSVHWWMNGLAGGGIYTGHYVAFNRTEMPGLEKQLSGQEHLLFFQVPGPSPSTHTVVHNP